MSHLNEFCSLPNKQGNYKYYSRQLSASKFKAGDKVYFSDTYPEVEVIGVDVDANAIVVEGYDDDYESISVSEILMITEYNNKQLNLINSMNKYKSIKDNKYMVLVNFKWDKEIIADFRAILGSNYNKDKKQNTLIIGKENIADIRQFTSKHKFHYEEVLEVMTTAKNSSLYRILSNGEALFPYSRDHNADLKQAGFRWNGNVWAGGNKSCLKLEWYMEGNILPSDLSGSSPYEILEELEMLEGEGKVILDDYFWGNAVNIGSKYIVDLNSYRSGFDSEKFIAELVAI